MRSAWLLFLLSPIFSLCLAEKIVCWEDKNVHLLVMMKNPGTGSHKESAQCRLTFKFPRTCSTKAEAESIKIISQPQLSKKKNVPSGGVFCDWESDTEVHVFYEKNSFTTDGFIPFMHYLSESRHATCDKTGGVDKQGFWECMEMMHKHTEPWVIPQGSGDGGSDEPKGTKKPRANGTKKPSGMKKPGPPPPGGVTKPVGVNNNNNSTDNGSQAMKNNGHGSDSDDESKEDGGFPIWAIILIVVAALLLIAVPIIVFVVIRKKKSKTNPGAVADKEMNKKAGEGDDDDDDDDKSKTNTKTKTTATKTLTATKTNTKTANTKSRTPTKSPAKSAKGGASTKKTMKTKKAGVSTVKPNKKNKRAVPPTLKLSTKKTMR